MRPPIDAFSLRARLAPAIIATAPSIALSGTLVTWTHFHVSQLLAGLVLTVLITAFSDFARRHGSSVQPGIFAAMGGRPSVAMLRHRDTRIHADTKARIIRFLAQRLGENPPTPADEHTNPDSAEAFYERCVNWLSQNTRDAKTFNILFEELITYNFRRNLLGLKTIGLYLSALTLLIAGIIALHRYLSNPSHDGSPFTLILIVSAIHGAYFLFGVNRADVEQAATTYAKQLLSSTDRLINSPPAITRARRPPRPKRSNPPTDAAST